MGEHHETNFFIFPAAAVRRSGCRLYAAAAGFVCAKRIQRSFALCPSAAYRQSGHRHSGRISDRCIRHEAERQWKFCSQFPRFPDCRLSGRTEFLLIASFKDDPLPFRWGNNPCLGKTHRLSAKHCSAGAAGNAEEEHLPGGQVFEHHFNQLFQSQLTAFRVLDSFILYIK